MRNLTRLPGDPIEIEAGEPAPAKSDKSKTAEATVGKVPDDAIAVWTDGACTGNPGPAGIGVVVIEGGERSELSEYLGDATNNIAELTAIERGLELVKERQQPEGRWNTSRSRSRPERHFTDSFATMRLAISRAIARWLPRCPACHAPRRAGTRRPLT